MHLTQAQALASGQKIGRIHIKEKFYALPFDKYICFSPFSKNSKNYDLYQDVIDEVIQQLAEKDIRIVQIGGPNERGFNHCYHTQGSTSINQLAYLIKNSIGYFGADTCSAHLAGHYDKNIIALYSNNYVSVVKPFFGSPEKQILLEPERPNGEKPSFSFDEIPKTINRIKVEDVISAFSRQYDLNLVYKHKTIKVGTYYNNQIIESVPNQVVDISSLGVDGLICRMDVVFDEQILFRQAQKCKVSIYTDKPIDINLLAQIKPQIKEVVYCLTPGHNPQFAKDVLKLGIKLILTSNDTEEQIRDYKIHFCEIGLIHPRPVERIKIENLYYKSKRFVLANGKVYGSMGDYLANRNLNGFEVKWQPVIDSDVFWKDAESYFFSSLDNPQ